MSEMSQYLSGKSSPVSIDEVHYYQYYWSINKFVAELHKTPTIESQVIETGAYKWSLQFQNRQKGISLVAKLHNWKSSEKVKASFECGIDSWELDDLVFYSKSTSFFTFSEEKSTVVVFPIFAQKNELLDSKKKWLDPDGMLRLTCKIGIKKNDGVYRSNLAFADLSRDLGRMVGNPDLSDVTFVIGDRRIPAHKVILSCRSSVFRAMFEHDRRPEVQLEDINERTFVSLLKFIYTGKMAQPAEDARGLLVAADKYNIQYLKDASEAALLRTITLENAFDLLLLADLHQCPELRKRALQVIGDHKEMFASRQEWKALLVNEAYHHIFIDIFKTVAGLGAHK